MSSVSGMDVEDIKTELRKIYGPLVHISTQLGLNRNAVSLTLRNSDYSIPTERKIAELLGKTPYEVWGPERFHHDGTPVERCERRETRAVPAHLRKRQVAA